MKRVKASRANIAEETKASDILTVGRRDGHLCPVVDVEFASWEELESTERLDAITSVAEECFQAAAKAGAR